MALAIDDLAALDPAAVAALEGQLAGLIAARYPAVDVGRGVVHDIVLHLAAILLTAGDENVERLRRSWSLKLIAADPAGADPEVVDRVLANYFVVRRAASAAAGAVTVILDAAVPLVIARGATFAAGTATFATSQAFAVRVDAAQVVDPSDRVLAPLGDGQYAATIPVACTVAGAAGMLRLGQALVPTTTIPRLVAVVAAGDFAGGREAESNADLVARLRVGVAAPGFGGRDNVAALVAADPAYAGAALSIVGAGDPELLRARAAALPLLLPGRCDVYVRTAPLPLAAAVPVTATLVAVGAAGGTWECVIPPGAAPGFLGIRRVATPAMDAAAAAVDPGFEVLADARAAAIPAGAWAPDLRPAPPGETAIDAAYTAYQAATVRFRDDRTPTASLGIGATAPYIVTVDALPGIADLQARLGARGARPVGGDVLVRAPVPCRVSCGIEVRLPEGATPPDAGAIAAAVAAAVNGLGFVGTLHSSVVAAAVQPFLPPGAALGSIDLFGRIRRPDGTVVGRRDPRGIAIAAPDEPDRGVSGRTVCFFLDPADVVVAARTIDRPAV